ncbi:Cytochrome c oxidase subunit 6B [Verticillium dahliae VDG1]|nr:Glutaryl-CoA dehydrogenase [Verticillium dahliae VDG2]KAF3354610.1 Cytochrome c oxidase subunit 6B [Verticillium dahliae VDG1]
MTKWKKQCDRNMERFDHIRKALARSPDERYIVHNFEESLMKWRASAEYGDGVKLIAQSGLNPLPCYLSSRPNHSSTPASESVNLGDEDNARANTPQAQTPISEPPEDDYNPEEDISVHVILYEDSESLPKENFEARGRETHAEPPAKASKGKMELETTNVATILKLGDKYEKSPNRLLELRSKDSLSYVHFPANNMSWIEGQRALDLYYGQDPPSFDGVIHELQEPYNTKTYMMLRPQYWRGQMHGSAGSAPHSRHMRPMCEAVSSAEMPYLHWETDRLRNKFALEMEVLADQWFENRQQKEQKRREERIKARKALHPDLRPSLAPKIQPKRNQLIESVLPDPNPVLVKQGLRIEKNGRVILSTTNPKRELGQFLVDAARLYEAMSTFRDRRLLKNYLNWDPPLHPRRTLDQAYYWTLNTTKSRDRDQVVYRATTAKSKDFHQFDNGGWPDHQDLYESPCRSCTAGIQKVSRVMMVDQLWMWVLDEKTLITSFPKRYGTQKYDYSGVHKAIRTKLDRARPNQIRSVFDLGLLVIDECSNTFFDRARKSDRQPQVIDQFSEAIGNVSRKETIAYDKLYKWTDNANLIYRRPGNSEMSELHVPLLDINPEAALHREIEDIKEELDIMIYVVRSHLFVLESFITHVKHMLDVYISDDIWGVLSEAISGASADTARGQMPSPSQNTTSPTPNARQAPQPTVYNDPEARKQIFRFFELNAKEVQTKIKWRIKELEQLRDSALSTCEGVKGLLALKQQQAGVVQAWMSLKQSEETVKQGRSIMLFTVVTIVFLPLTFTAAIFGMNALELGSNGSLKIGQEFATICKARPA